MDKSIEWSMKTREEILAYGLSLPDTYQEAPFHDQNWQLVRVRESKKAFLWTYMRNGFLNLNVKADPQWRDFWRSAYPAVIPGYHQNKEHWNTIIVDGTIPDKDICRMIAESYELVTDSPTRRIYEAVKKIPKGKSSHQNMTFLEENPVLYYKIIWMSGCAAEWSVDIGQCGLWALMANRKRGTTEYGSVYKLCMCI